MRTVTGISVNTAEMKTEFEIGEVLDLSDELADMVVTVTFDDGSAKMVAYGDCQVNDSQYLGNIPDTYPITVRWQGYSNKFYVTVIDPNPDTLPGTVSISPPGPVGTGTRLSANYYSSEPVSFQWNKDGAPYSKNLTVRVVW